MATAHPAVVEGAKVLVVERRPPLQPTLDRLLASLIHVRISRDIRPGNGSALCEQQRDHPFETLREGRHVGLDGVVRDLRIQMCPRCGAACVRDISRDRLDGLPTGRNGAARRDMVLGWYSGKRRAGREYR